MATMSSDVIERAVVERTYIMLLDVDLGSYSC
jgi:hypothetical protein